MRTDAVIIEKLRAAAKQLRRDVVEMTGPGQSAYFGGAFSSAELLASLYFEKLRLDPQNPTWPDRDRLILSKGHICILLYAALARAGFFPVEELSTLKQLGSRLQGYPDMRLLPGAEASTGSLGQGLSIGLGLALGMQLDQKSSRVYVLLGDGELAEGQVWEAAMAAANYKLNNLVAIVDRNRMQATGFTEKRMDSGDLAAKWEAFGWHVIEIDGHDCEAILAAYEEAETIADRPTVILANTISGKGLSFAENNPAFHNGILTEAQYAQALMELAEKEA